MKVLVILGSGRKANTYRAVERIREIIQKQVSVDWEYAMLGDIALEQCRGCYTCFDRGEEHCPIKDESASLEQKMMEADGVIFATPVYGFQVSGLMKTFIDRHSYVFHRPRFFRQKALLLASAGWSGQKDVLKYLDMVARVWGFEVAARAEVTSHALMKPLPPHVVEENERQLQVAAASFLKALQRGNRSKPGLMDVIFFHIGRAGAGEAEERGPADYEYWKERGWLDKERRYFVDVAVNPLYHGIGTLEEWFVRRQIRKDWQETPST